MDPIEKIPRIHVKLNSPLLPILVVVFLALGLISSYEGWTVLLVVFGGLWLFAYLWTKSLAGGLRLKREIRFGWAQVGDHLDERFTLTHVSWAPAIWVEVDDRSNLPGYCAKRVTGVQALEGGNQWQIKGICRRRGVFTLGPTSLRTGDPFGVYTVHLEYPQTTSLVVTPPILPLPSIQVAPAGRIGEGRRRMNALERSVSSVGLRAYTPGDSLRWIHWPTTAHQGSLFVRLLEGISSADWWILLNLQEEAQVGGGFESTVELGIILAASLVDTGLKEAHRVGLLMAGERTIWLPPRLGGEHRRLILRELARAETGSHSLEDLLCLSQTYIKESPSLVIITPPAGGEWISSLLPLLKRGAVATVLLLDPVSFGGETDPAEIEGALVRLGVNYYVLGRELLQQPEAYPGRWGQWEWKIGASGRAIPLRRPKDLSWKRLT
jgi:uncharacterized protein (DUF58 family)